MIDLIFEELDRHKGKCLIFVGESQLRILQKMSNLNRQANKRYSLAGHELIEVKEKSFLKIISQ